MRTARQPLISLPPQLDSCDKDRAVKPAASRSMCLSRFGGGLQCLIPQAKQGNGNGLSGVFRGGERMTPRCVEGLSGSRNRTPIRHVRAHATCDRSP